MRAKNMMRVRQGTSERGALAVYVAVLAPVLLIFAALAVDVARWYVELQRLQKTVDAAALAAAPFMPETLQNNQSGQAGPYDRATAAARELVSRNGYSGIDARIEQGARPSQVRVSLTSTVDNGLASVIGIRETTLGRSAVAEFAGPAPLGSPCNVHGNEPWVSGGNQGSVLPSPLPANCGNYPQFWATIVGPEVYKTQGDQFAARKCGASPQESGCVTPGSGGANAEYDPLGYVITVRVTEQLTGPLTVELYDPAYVDTGSTCDQLPSSYPRNRMNVYVNDARERYANNSTPFGGSPFKPSYCSGDNDNQGLRFGSETPTVTSFGLIKPTETFNPFDPAANAAGSNRICAVQYPGFSKAGAGNNEWETPHVSLSGDTAREQLGQNQELTRLFHRWVPFCTIPGPVPAGDYYLRVRSNVAWGQADRVFDTDRATADNTAVQGNGSNRFAVRAVPTGAADRAKVSVSPFARMPIFANSQDSAATFNLVRVLPGNAGQTINFTFYDVGDAGGPPGATLSVLRPSGAPATGCTKEGFENGPDPDCSITNILNANGWNGQRQQMRIPIPSDYTCDFSNPFDCWWRLRVQFSGGVSVTDQTTWTAVVEGDPVRLVE